MVHHFIIMRPKKIAQWILKQTRLSLFMVEIPIIDG